MINQVKFSDAIKFFEKGFIDKYGLKPYYSRKEPCLFIGVYNRDDILAINRHDHFKIIKPVGRDIVNLPKIRPYKSVVTSTGDMLKKLKAIDSRFIFKDVKIALKDYSRFKLTEKGDCVYYYVGNWQDVDKKLIKIIEREFELIIGEPKYDMDYVIENYYKRSFVNLRPSVKGGTTAIEMAYMGRRSISNLNNIYSVPYKRKNIISVIHAEKEKELTSIIPDNYFIDNRFLNLEFWLQ